MVQWDVCQNLATELHIIYNYNNYIYTLYNGQKNTLTQTNKCCCSKITIKFCFATESIKKMIRKQYSKRSIKENSKETRSQILKHTYTHT